MKSALNGGLNLSIRDGWWDEFYDGANGWAIPTADGVDDPHRRDDLEANALYDLIEKDVAPRFYDVDHDGVPGRWIEMVRHTLKSLGPKVLATRMVRDYVRQLYTPAAVTGRALNSDYKGAAELASWKKQVRAAWDDVRVEHVESHGVGDNPEVGSVLTVRAFVALGPLTPDDVAVEVVHGVIDGDDDLVARRRVRLLGPDRPPPQRPRVRLRDGPGRPPLEPKWEFVAPRWEFVPPRWDFVAPKPHLGPDQAPPGP
jgi:glycogen phosphorylase